MFVHPLSINNLITNIDSMCNQPNAVDIRVSELKIVDDMEHSFSAQYDQLVTISDKGTEHKQTSNLVLDSDNYWSVYRGTYQFSSPHFVSIPEGYCGYLITRSSLNRNGIFIQSGLYDSGFNGFVGGTLYNFGGRLKLEYNVRICQFVLLKAETVKMYDGQYQTQLEVK